MSEYSVGYYIHRCMLRRTVAFTESFFNDLSLEYVIGKAFPTPLARILISVGSIDNFEQ
jgi:hypothetical protein